MMMDIGVDLQLDIGKVVGKRVAVLGITGTGKTNTAAVLIEEMLSAGLTMTILDVEGEYYGLKERYELVVAGKSDHADLPIAADQAAALARMSVERGISIILDVSGYKKSESAQRQELVEAYFTELWDACSEKKRPYEIVLEEAHTWIPQDKSSSLKDLLTEFALQGRKRGVGIILASQRSAKVEKDILTQVPLLFLHQVVHPIDLNVYKDLIALPPKEVVSLIRKLQIGEAIVNYENVPHVVQIRKRHTFHPGATPELGVLSQPELKRIDDKLLQELQKILAVSRKAVPTNERHFEKRIKELEALLAERDATIQKQAERIELLSQLTVHSQIDVNMPETMHIAHAHIEKASVNHAQATTTIVEAEPVQRIATPINQQKLKSLKAWIAKNVSPSQMKMLQTLYERNTWMSGYEISSWSGVSENVIRSNPPHSLLRRGILTREKYSNGYQYRSQFQSFLQQEFPGADIDQIISLIFA